MAFPVTPGWHLIENQVRRKKVPTLLYYIPKNPTLSTKIAAFDFVNTLIWSDRGDYTVRGVENWVWRSETLPSFLSKLLEDPDPWTVVIFSNYISKNLEELQSRVERVEKDVQVYSPDKGLFFFASLTKDHNQKPNTGMWEAFTEIWHQLTGKELSPHPDSFYIGDRAGDLGAEDPMFRKGGVDVSREELEELGYPEGTSFGDDSLFAARIGLNFLLPSELPSQPEPDFPPEGSQKMIIMVGQQGSGKTTWATSLSESLGYTLVASEPTPGRKTLVINDKKGRLRIIEKLLREGESLIIDATHPSRASRAELINLAKKYNVPVRIFWISRPGRPYNELRPKPVQEVALRTYTKNFERPSIDEGAEVVRIV